MSEPNQQAAAEFQSLEALPHGVTLIEASAGTGKTYTITTLVLRLVVEENIPVDRVLVVTFTEAATAELQSRIRVRLRDALDALDRLPDRPQDPVWAAMLERAGVLPPADSGDTPTKLSAAAKTFLDDARRRLALAVTSFDQAAISTIHGFCQRTLRENAFESGIVFDTELIGDQTDLIAEAVSDFWVNRQHAGDRGFLRYIEKIGVTPGSLFGLAATALADPEMPVFPEVSIAEDTADFDAWAEAYNKAQVLWRDERETVRQMLADEVSAKRLHGGTYRADSMAKRYLEIGAFFAGDAFQMAKLPASLPYISREKIAGAMNGGKEPPHHPLFDAVDAMLAIWTRIDESLERRLVAFKRQLVAFVREEVPQRKATAQIQSFDDLLLLLDRALRGPRGGALAAAVRSRYRVALIDEFQDTDPVQYRIFSRIFAPADPADRGRLFLIGDPKQAIYAFRGADIFAYIKAAASAETRRTLPTNYRSSPRLVDAVNHLFARCPNPFGLSEIRFQPVNTPDSARSTFRVRGRDPAPFALYFRPQNIDGETGYNRRPQKFPSAAECTAAAIVEMLRWESTFVEEKAQDDGTVVEEERKVVPGDVAVLVRSNWEGQNVQRALQRRGIPCVIQDGSSVYASEEGADLLRLMQALVEPNRISVLRAALVTSVLGLSGDDLLRLDASPETWDSVVDLFREWRDLWTRRGFIHAYRAILAQRLRLRDPERPESPPAHLLRLEDGERRMTNLLHLAELLHEAETTERMSPAGLVRWLAARRADGGDRDASQLRMESDAAAVKITTIHKSKGLEYPIVFCPFLCSPSKLRESDLTQLRYHDVTEDRALKLDLDPTDDVKQQAEFENFAEDMRLLYVALTRAKQRCVVIWDTGKRDVQKSALAWLLFAQQGETRDALAARLSSMGESGQFDALKELAHDVGDAMRFHMLSPDVDRRLDRSNEEDVRLEVRRSARTLSRNWRITSYSGLVADSPDRGPGEEGHDHALDGVANDPSPAGSGDRVLLADVPAGARFGRMIHQVFELADFTAISGAEARGHVTQALSVHGFDDELFDPVHAAVQATVDTPLDDTGLTLSDVTREARLDELGFLFPVRARGGKVAKDRIASVFEAHGGPALAPVAAAVDRLTFEPFQGFLKGFIDLTFVHEDKWYVVDYKSNDLGPTRDAYARPRLDAAMLHGMYHLQYHLYCVAVNRYLKWRVPGWSYDKHFGGVFYLFLRGMSPESGSEFGVFRDRPSSALVRALDVALDSGSGGAK